MIQKIHTFQNCASAVEDIRHPETNEVSGRAFVIIDQDTGDVYRYPMPDEVAKEQGRKLMGLEGVEIANGAKAAAVLRNIDKRPKR